MNLLSTALLSAIALAVAIPQISTAASAAASVVQSVTPQSSVKSPAENFIPERVEELESSLDNGAALGATPKAFSGSGCFGAFQKIVLNTYLIGKGRFTFTAKPLTNTDLVMKINFPGFQTIIDSKGRGGTEKTVLLHNVAGRTNGKLTVYGYAGAPGCVKVTISP